MAERQVIAVLGTGTIGASWAALFLAMGQDVRAWDPAPGAAERLQAALAQAAPSLAAHAGAGRLSLHPSPEEAATGAGFVQENAPERLELKRALYARIEPVLEPEVVIATSTSGIMPSALQEGMAHPERLVVGHPFNPPHLVPLVEVVPGRQTSEAAVAAAMAFYRAMGKEPIRLNREVIGHVANRLQGAVLREIVHLAKEGVASVADLDRAMSLGPGQRWAFMGQAKLFALAGGPQMMAHFLDHLGPAVETWWADLGAPELDDEARRLLSEAYPPVSEAEFRAVQDWRDAALLRRLAALEED